MWINIQDIQFSHLLEKLNVLFPNSVRHLRYTESVMVVYNTSKHITFRCMVLVIYILNTCWKSLQFHRCLQLTVINVWLFYKYKKYENVQYFCEHPHVLSIYKINIDWKQLRVYFCYREIQKCRKYIYYTKFHFFMKKGFYYKMS